MLLGQHALPSQPEELSAGALSALALVFLEAILAPEGRENEAGTPWALQQPLRLCHSAALQEGVLPGHLDIAKTGICPLARWSLCSAISVQGNRATK